MKMTFTVLSKSAKKNNKCVAGMLEDGRLVRIVSADEETDGAIPAWYLKNRTQSLDVQVLDVIEVEAVKMVPDEIQRENCLVNLNVLPRVIGRTNLKEVAKRLKLDDDPYVFLNDAPFLRKAEAKKAGYSLKFIVAHDVYVQSVDSHGKRKTKVDFTFKGRRYNRISLTDPDYFEKDGHHFSSAALFLSLPRQPFVNKEGEERYYKFLARLFPLS